MAESSDLPRDFGARLRAARAYADDMSREAFAELIGEPGAGASTLKKWEAGTKGPTGLQRDAFIRRAAEVSGLPEAFFWGEDAGSSADRVSRRLESVEEALRDLQRELAVRDLEGHRRSATSDPPGNHLQRERRR